MKATSPATKVGQRKLSEVARHVHQPDGIVSTGWPAVRDRLAQFSIPFDLWQQGVGRLLLAKRADGIYAAGVGGAIISIPRQVGKTYMVGWIVFALCTLIPGLTVIWTAHHTRTSNETFGKMRAMAAKAKVSPYIENVRSANGEQSVNFKNGSRILFGARDQGFGLGFDMVDILVLDEAQRVKEVAMADMVPATNAAPNGLVVLMGTPPRPTDNGDVFAARREDALGGDPDTLYIELSADEGAKIIDWDQVAKANPSYPHRTGKTAILRMQKLLGSDEGFNREGYGIWAPKGANKGKIPLGTWSLLGLSDVSPSSPVVSAELRTGFQQSLSVVAAYQVAGLDVVDLGFYESGVGLHWSETHAAEKVAELCKKLGVDTVVVDEHGDGNVLLIPQLEGFGLTVVKFTIADARAAAVGFVDGVLNKRIWHVDDQQALAVAAVEAQTKPSQDGFLWSQPKSDIDVGPVRAASNAWWAMNAAMVADYDLMDSFF